jgi:hypothetical protein
MARMNGFVRRGLSAYVDVLMSRNPNGIVHQFFGNPCDSSMRSASFLTELLLIKEGKLHLCNYDSRLLSRHEIDNIIAKTRTS